MKRIFLLITILCLDLVVSAQTTDHYTDSIKKNHTDMVGYHRVEMPAVRFSSDFESGSLGMVECLYADSSKTEQNSVFLIESRSDPRNPFDSTYITSGRWFFFRMTGTQNRTIHLLLKNTDPQYPVFSYDGKRFERFAHQECDKGRVRKTFDKDTVYVAYCFPYTNDRLMRRTSEWLADSCLDVSVIGFSEQYRPIYLYTFGDPSIEEAQKRQVYIQSRVHSSETPASFVLEGFIDALMEHKELLRSVSFHIVPFANPDGVVGGYSRSNAIGVNLEGNFVNSTSPTQPETKALLSTIERLYDKQPLDVMLDLHAQVAPKLMLWLHTAATSSEVYYRKEMEFFNAVARNNPLFSPADSTFAKLPTRSIERWAWDRGQGRTLAQTFEATYERLNTTRPTWVSEENMLLTGRRLFSALEQFLCAPSSAKRLMEAYPQTIVGYSNGELIIADGRQIAFNDTIFSVPYPKGALSAPPTTDPGRVRDETLLKTLYGSTPQEVESHLVQITWCPKLVGQKLQITTRNNVHLALQKVSDELDRHAEWKQHLRSCGTYNWRTIAGTDRLSAHSFGIAIDLSLNHTHYWKWDYPKANESTPIGYKNKLPQAIVDIFEKHGFIWGGKWLHYDTMHFEYRPELL